MVIWTLYHKYPFLFSFSSINDLFSSLSHTHTEPLPSLTKRHSINLHWYQIIELSYFYALNRNIHIWHKPDMEKSKNEWMCVCSYVCYEYISILKIIDLGIIFSMS